MPELLQRKVGIVACSGEELAEGTVTRLAALRVLEQLRPGQTVTICLPLFLAGGEGDRAFARFYPTIAVDGCATRCAARATEQLSGRPAASVVVSDLVHEAGLARPEGARHLDENGRQAVELTADRVAGLVDDLLGGQWSRRSGSFVEPDPALPAGQRAPSGAAARGAPAGQAVPAADAIQAACACASAIPCQDLDVAGRTVSLAALPLILEQLHAAGRVPGADVGRELLEIVRIYNDVRTGTDEEFEAALAREYAAFCRPKETPR